MWLNDGRPIPPDDADELTWLLFRQENVISRRQALGLMSRTVLQSRLEAGRWQSVHRGVYVAQSGPLTDGQRHWAAVLAVGRGRSAHLAGLSALNHLGLRGFPSDRIHVLLSSRLRDHDPPPGVVVHRTSTLPPEHRLPLGAPPCTTPARSLVDAAQWAVSDDQARTIVAAAFQQRLVGGDDVARVLATMRRAHRRALIGRTALDARDGSHSLAEIDIVALCRRAGLPPPSRQVSRTDSAGRARYLDLYWAEWGVHVEIDGGHHMEVRQWWDDMRRQNELWIAGDRVLRFPAWLVRNRPAEVEAAVRAALTAAGWTPTPSPPRARRPRRPGRAP